MARTTVFFVCVLVIGLDVAAGICGFQAENAQTKARHMRLWLFECKDPSHEAFELGVGAAALLALAHVIANLLGGCFCILGSHHKHQSACSNRQLATFCLVFTWIIGAIGMGMLVLGTLANERSKASCGVTHHKMFSFGGILCFVHALFSVAYVLLANCGHN